MTARRSAAIARGTVSLAVTAALLIGVPMGLATLVGWPLPTTLPDGHTLSRALRIGIDDEIIVNTLAVIAWLAWAQFALALAAESIGLVRGARERVWPSGSVVGRGHPTSAASPMGTPIRSAAVTARDTIPRAMAAERRGVMARAPRLRWPFR